MKHITSQDLTQLDRFYRGNLINSVTGFKSANLLATRSKNGVDNVAIFSSVTHIGSDPAMFSFVQRPLGHGVGHTYMNLKETGKITLNHINLEIVNKAHQSSSKYPESTSEFDELGIKKLQRHGFTAPFVKNATIQVAADYVNEYYLEENKCILVICKITDVFFLEEIQHEDGWLNLEKARTVAINGLDGYASARVEKRLTYVKVDQPLKEINF